MYRKQFIDAMFSLYTHTILLYVSRKKNIKLIIWCIKGVSRQTQWHFMRQEKWTTLNNCEIVEFHCMSRKKFFLSPNWQLTGIAVETSQYYLSKHHNHLDPWSVLVAENMVHEGGTWISTQRGATFNI